MYAGRIVEAASADALYARPRHPYTIGLLRSVPRLDRPVAEKLMPIEGHPSDPLISLQAAPFIRAALRARGLPRRGAPDARRRRRPWHRLHPRRPWLKLPGAILVETRNLEVQFAASAGLFRVKRSGVVRAVDRVSLQIRRGETLGLVGESGCGKSTLGRAILRLTAPTAGPDPFDGQDLTDLPEAELRQVRRNMQMIFQDPFGSLDPRMTVGDTVAEPILVHRLATSANRRDKVAELFRLVHLDPRMANRYPHEFSGGQRQRIGVARALAASPSFIVCDEPVSALDVSIQAQIVNLLEELRERLRLTYLFVSHDLAVVRHLSDRIAVMYLGEIVEIAPKLSLYDNPLHPYTRALIAAVPVPDPAVELRRARTLLHGEVPSPLNPPSGCRLHPRCPHAMPMCSTVAPQPREVAPGHVVACHLYAEPAGGEQAARVETTGREHPLATPSNAAEMGPCHSR